MRCVVSDAACAENQWPCETSGRCIPIEHLCDTVQDCDDNSDEVPRRDCQSPVLVRLADGPAGGASGRVEIRHHQIWGTICDDDFGPEDAAVSPNLT